MDYYQERVGCGREETAHYKHFRLSQAIDPNCQQLTYLKQPIQQ